MISTYRTWNRAARKLLLVLTALGVLAALPLGFARHAMEEQSNRVEFVFDYRDLLMIAAYQAHPQQFVAAKLEELKAAGITTMAVFEGSFEEFGWAGRLSLYNSAQAAALLDEPVPADENYTYVLFQDELSAAELSPIVQRAFQSAGIPVAPWSFEGRAGLKLETPVENATVKPMAPDPIAMRQLKAAGFELLPRLSDRVRPYDPVLADELLGDFAALGATRVLFDGDAVTGFADQADMESLDHFAGLLRQYGLGIVSIEGLKIPQAGFNTLAYDVDYDVVRLYSLSETDAATMTPDAIADRFLLAAKDRNIRMFYLNGVPLRSAAKASITDPIENLKLAIAGEGGAIAKLAEFGFETGRAESFDYTYAGWQKALRAVVALGAVAVIALLVDKFLRGTGLLAFLIGLIGTAGLYVLSSSLLEQGLALGASIAVPTLAVIWALGRIRAHTEGDRRTVGGWQEENPGSGPIISGGYEHHNGMAGAGGEDRLFGGKWLFDGPSAGKRLVSAVSLFAVTSFLSLCGAAFVFGLLTNITYSLVLQQFRGVSLLHLAPIALVALYVFLYTGGSVFGQLRKLLRLRITVLGAAAAVVLGAVGFYYLSRTGNAGQATALELTFRNLLESTFGVRPRFKEFMLAHPLFLLGLFLSLRYRAAWVLMIVGVLGQLSMVDTFAHIHTPIILSFIRGLLGLGLGLIIGLCLIGVWQLAEGAWRRWGSKIRESFLSA